ncbi:MAG: ABC transporter substrate-binding protein, partial [Spirochaetaceae bacterium]|nr:ABC transporter substrate-binding protein [Spirochaetaceae bacterium]
FNLVEWVPQNRIVAVPNPRYWDSENVFIDRLSFLPIVDQNASLNAFRNGEVDWGVHGSFPPQLIDELRLRPDFHINPSVLTEAYAFNASHAAVSDPRVRRAIAMAINRRELVDSVTRQGQTPARGWVPISMANYDHIPDEGFYNPEAARALLAEAGFPGGQGFPTIQVIYNTAETHRLNGEFIQAQLRDNLGITLNLQNMEWGSFLESRIFPTTIMFRMGWMGSDGDPMYFLQIFETGDSNNNFNYSNPEFDALLQYARTLPDGPQRMAVLRQAEDIVVVQDQVIVPLHYGVNNNLIDLSKWAGWYINPYDLHPYVGIRPR